MSIIRKLFTINEDEEEIWTPDVETVLREALILYPAGKRKIKQDGRIYGRNSLISMYIEKKCGKIRTNNQIASHLQVLMLRKESKLKRIQKQLAVHGIVAPEVYRNELLSLTDSGAIKFSKLKEDHYTEHYFTDNLKFISNIFDILPYRRISGEKLALLSVLIYIHEPNEYTDFLFTNTITRGFTCVTDSIMPEIHLSQVQHYFGQDLIKLYNRAPKSAFYLVKSWNNIYFPKGHIADFIWDSIFYSKYLMSVRDESTCYIMGQKLYSGVVERMAVDEISYGSSRYYIYSCQCNRNHNIQITYLKHLKKIYEAGDVETLKIIMRNQSRLVTFTDNDTQEILLVLACINDYMPDFTGYQYFKIIL